MATMLSLFVGAHLSRVFQSRRYGKAVRQHTDGDDGQRKGLYSEAADCFSGQYCIATI